MNQKNNKTNESILKDSLELAKSALNINTTTGTVILKQVLIQILKTKDQQHLEAMKEVIEESAKYISKNAALYGVIGDVPEEFAEEYKQTQLKNLGLWL